MSRWILLTKMQLNNRWIRIPLKILLWILGSIAALLVILVIAFQIPNVQNFAAQKGVSWLQQKLGTTVRLEKLSIGFPKTINISGLYIEDKQGDTLVYIANLNVGADMVGLLNNRLFIQSVDLQGVIGNVSRSYPDTTFNYNFIIDAFVSDEPAAVEADTSAGMEISVRNISLNHIKLTYNDEMAGSEAYAYIGDFETSFDEFDLNLQHFTIDHIKLEGAKIAFAQNKPQQIDTLVEEVIKEDDFEKQMQSPEWRFLVKKLNLRNNVLKYDNNDSLPKPKGLDYNHIEVRDFDLLTSNVYVTPGQIKLNLDTLAFAEKSGLTLNRFSGEISYDTTNITLANLEILTPNSRIGNHMEANFTSVTTLADSLENVDLRLVFDDTRIAVADVLYFMPDLTSLPQVNISDNEILSLNGAIKGSLKELAIDNISVSNNRSTHILVNAIVKEVLSPDKMYASVDNLSFGTTRTDIQSYFATGLILSTVSVPDALDLNIKFEGLINNFSAVADLSTTYGNVNTQLDVKQILSAENMSYDGSISVDALDLGRLLRQPDTLGPVTLRADLQGTGISPENLHANINLTLEEALYNKYHYRDLVVNGKVVNSSFEGTAGMQDENLNFSFDGLINAHPDSLALVFDLHLNKADLKALNLSDDTLQIAASVSSDIAKTFGPNPIGTLKIYDAHLKQTGLNCPIDSMIVKSVYENDSSKIDVSSSFLNASISGDFILTDILPVLSKNIEKYFRLPVSDTSAKVENEIAVTEDTTRSHQNFNFSVSVQSPNDICENLVPGLTYFSPLQIGGSYNSADSRLAVNAQIPRIEYDAITIDSLVFDMESDARNLDYKLYIGEISTDSLALEMFDVEGTIADNRIQYSINAQKTDTFNVLRTSGVFAVENIDYTLVIDEPLVLNNTVWKIDPDNLITFSNKGIDAQKVILTGSGQLISILTQPGDYIPLKVSFENFSLANFSQIIEKETDLVRGQLNGHVTLLSIEGVSAFTSDLTIDSLQFMENPVGNITLKANNSSDPTKFNIDFNLGGYGNELSAAGSYTAKDSTGVLDLNVDIPRLNMKTIEPFTFGQVNRMSGFISGGFRISGTTAELNPVGSLAFNDVALNAPITNTYLKVGNNTVNIRNRRLIIDNFILTDTLNNTAQLNGFADFSDPDNLTFDMRLVTSDFLALNSVKRQEDMPLYGKVILDSDMHVTGTPSSPVIDMKVQLNNGSEFVFVMPESQITLNESEGIVVFTDSLLHAPAVASDTVLKMTSNIQGIALNASISFQPEAVLKMLIDPVAGDSLYVSGDGTLNFVLEPGGQMNLTGRYNINNGGYNITLNQLLKRQFTIKEGSSITWTGDIMNALVDLTAVYQVRTSPLLLLEDQIDATDEASRNRYRNAMTFLVNLSIEGDLMSPEISFDIDQPEVEKGAMGGAVNAKLNELRTDPSQLNKQVFALLALNRFLGQDPFETGNAPITVESATRSSASKILTQQFSALSAKYIKGVDLDVGVNSFEDYSSGTEQGRTQLQLGVSKEFLNDRITVQIGGNVELEGERARQNNASDLAGNVNVEYKLRPDGRYRLRGFRRIEYENPIEGELINTGIGFSYSREFVRFRQLFLSDKKLRELREQRRQSEAQKDKINYEQEK